MYLTPRRFKKSGHGLDLSAVPDHELTAALVRAASRTERYCNAPLEPQRHSFKGGSITDEHRSWIDTTARRIYPFHQPVKTISRLVIDATNNLNIAFDADELYVNPTDGYVEIINFALSKVGIWNIADLPSFGLVQPVAHIDYTYGYDFSVTDEELTPTDVSGEYMAENGWWDPDAVVTIDDVAADPGDYELDAKSGMLILTAPDPSVTVSASYVYHLPHDIAEANLYIGRANLIDSGFARFSGFEEIQVEELRLRRPSTYASIARGGTARRSKIPEEAQDLLDAFVFSTMR